MTWEVLCKCSGKYIDIYFNLKITFQEYEETCLFIIARISASILLEYIPTF